MIDPTFDPVPPELIALIEKARVEGKMLWNGYQDIWFYPQELAKMNAEGRLLWSAENWKLRFPSERLAASQRRLDQAIAEHAAIAASMPAPTT